MRQYLRTIHTRSDSHKRRFAFLTSSGITLSIFLLWTLVRVAPFSSEATIATNDTYGSNTANAVAPFDSITAGVGESFSAIKDQFNSVKGEVKSVDLESEYEQMRSEALDRSKSNPQ
jgi:hypothetical protein